MIHCRGSIALLLLAACGPLNATGMPAEDVELGSNGLVLYREGPAPFKAYVASLRTPSGIEVLEDSPADHVHHHALMFGVGVDGSDFWGEADPAKCGTQVSERFLTSSLGSATCKAIIHQLHWTGADGERLLDEERLVSVGGGREATTLSWTSTLRLFEGREQARLSGAHYFGLGLRFHPDMKGNGEFLADTDRESVVVRGDERMTRARWMAWRSSVGEKPVTVALFDDPLNPRYPASFFTMARPFAFLSATLDLHERERILRSGETITLRYGVTAWDGHRTREEIEMVWQSWAGKHARPDLALTSRGASAFASSEFGPDYSAAKAIDGRSSVRETDKWNSARGITPHYLSIDLGQEHRIDTLVIRHEGALPIFGAHVFDASDFRIQASPKRWGPWTDLVPPVRDNSDDVTVHRFEPTKTRHVRVLLETAEQGGGNDYGRIVEVEVYAARESR
jgi:hypothetical protein